MNEFIFSSPEPQQGWQCPVCRRVYAPWMAQCLTCGGERKTYTTSNTEYMTNDEFFEKYGITVEECLKGHKKGGK